MQAADPHRMLPTDLRAAWLVVPRAFLLRLLLAGALLGAGIATTAVGFASGSSTLMLGLPVALIALRLLDVVRWPDDRASTSCRSGIRSARGSSGAQARRRGSARRGGDGRRGGGDERGALSGGQGAGQPSA